MCKRFVCLTSLVVILTVAGASRAELIGHWTLDETSGTTATDFSGREHHGTYVDNPGLDIPGVYGTGMDTAGGYMEVDLGDDLPIQAEERTIALWVNTPAVRGDRKFCSYGNASNGQGFTFCIENVDGQDGVRMRHWGGNMFYPGFITGQWNHIAMRVPAGATIVNDTEVFINGQNIPGYRSGGSDQTLNTAATPFYVGTSIATQTGQAFDGLLDDVYFYDHALSESEIIGIMEGQPWPYAFGPVPADGSLHESTWVNLSWMPGELAVSHDVYMGDHFIDVNEATRESDVFRGNQVATFYVAGFPGFAFPEGLVPGTTYYWRIDEVNDADPNSPWKGNIWCFTVPSKQAYNPDPIDGATYVNADITLSWTPGMGALLHTVYFGDNVDEINNAAGGTPLPETTYSPGTLELEKTYYWRVDEFDGVATHKGDVWSFSTKPNIAITDPELLCWWTLEEGEGTTVLDWSGHGADGEFVGDPEWVDGYDGRALNFDGTGESVIYRFDDETWTAYTMTVWAKADILWQSNNSSICATNSTTAGGFQFSFDGANNYRYHSGIDQEIGPASLSWVHLAVTYDGTLATAYYNGEFVATFTPAAVDLVVNKYAIGTNRAEDNWFDGSVDEFRVYSRALSQEEIQLIMRGDPLVAWNPSPADDSNPDIDAALPLSWSPGDNASQHDVYFGLDKDALDGADSSDATGLYRGRQNVTTYTPPEGVEWGGGPYYWRIDEVNTDGTISKGRIWTFTVADFILVDDFESYTDDDTNGQAIWQHWIDGFGVSDNGAQVGYLLPPYAEQTIVNNGGQSMPLLYDNTAGVVNSEAVLTLTTPRDWTRHGLTDLSLWSRGYPASDGSFVEAPADTYTMTASGADIWGTADQFHYAFKTLTGAGSMIARVNSLQNTHISAKAGVMIRETLDPGSKHAFACMTSGNGVASQGRTATDGTSYSTNETGITTSHWVKLERDAAGNFTVSHSTNGTTWQSVASAVPTNIPMTSNVYIGLAVTSHDVTQTCQAVFSNVTTTGNVSGQWAHQDVGITTNAAEPMYVELSNANGTSAIIANEDPAAATIDTWTEWRIPLQAFADQGVNLTDVDRIAIGLGAKAGIPAPGGLGTVYVDDIRLYPPAPESQP